YLLHLLLPLGLLFLLAPLALVAALPELALNVLSATSTQTSIHFHYTAGAIPPLVIASVLGAAVVARRRPAHVDAITVAAVAAEETRSSYADRSAPLPAAAALVRLRQSREWTLVFERDGVLIFHRRTP